MPINHRVARHEFSVGDLPPETFRVVNFEGEEAISTLYHVEINLVSNDPAIAFKDVVGQSGLLTMLRGDDASPLYGLVVGFEQAGMHHGQTDYPYMYRAALVPHLSALAMTTQSRIFQNLTVKEIVTQILADHSVVASIDFHGSYEAREYCTQYQESDLAFVQRLLEYEGAYYYFDHVHDVQKGASGGAVETVIIRDTASEDIVDVEQPSGVPYRQGAGLLSADGDEFIGAFVVRQQLVTAQAEVVDYNYRTAETKILEPSEKKAEQAAGSSSEFSVNAATPARAKALAAVRSEEIETSRLVMTGDGDVQRFRAGFTFDLKDHYRADLNQAYRITSVRHVGGQASAAGGDEGSATLGYRNTFACLPASVAYRPARLTPEPRLPGILTARVETTGGDYAPVDEFGRYRIRFPFDQSDTPQAGATKAVRMAQPYTGPGYGHHFPVHAGTEMVVACVNGNVDRILGLSTIWNSTENSPVTSDNASQSVLRSWGKNEIRFDDKKGHEDVFMHATKNHTVTINNNESISVGGDRSQSVGHDETLSVGNDQTETVEANLSLTVGGNRIETIAGDDSQFVGGTRIVTVACDNLYSVDGDRNGVVIGDDGITVGGDRAAAIGGDDKTRVEGDQEVEVTGDFSLGAEGDATFAVTGDVEIRSAATMRIASDSDMTVESPTTITITADTELKLICGSSSITLSPSGITIDAVQITSSASTTHQTSGAMVSSVAQAINEVKGAIVKLN